MNPKLIYFLIREFLDREKRERLVKILIFIITINILLISFIQYILEHPIDSLLKIIGVDTNSSTYTMIQDFRNENNVIEGALYNGRDIPLFFQYDTRWGNHPYAGETIKKAGCGPTALAMVIVGLTGDTSVTPQTVADFSTSRGWAINGAGSSWSLMTEGARAYGLNAEQVSTSASSLVENLSQGKVMIVSTCYKGYNGTSTGYFTTGGHFIVLTGLTEDGRIRVNDSWSDKKSNETFTPEFMQGEIKGAWAYSYDNLLIEDTLIEDTGG